MSRRCDSAVDVTDRRLWRVGSTGCTSAVQRRKMWYVAAVSFSERGLRRTADFETGT